MRIPYFTVRAESAALRTVRAALNAESAALRADLKAEIAEQRNAPPQTQEAAEQAIQRLLEKGLAVLECQTRSFCNLSDILSAADRDRNVYHIRWFIVATLIFLGAGLVGIKYNYDVVWIMQVLAWGAVGASFGAQLCAATRRREIASLGGNQERAD